MRRVRVVILITVLAVAILVVWAASASAYPGLTSWSERQSDPGLTVRTIYGSAQVFMYELPGNVTHKGYIHASLSYRPGDFDAYIYLIDSAGQICNWTESQGYAGTWGGTEVVDFLVPSITDKTPVLDDQGDQVDIVGDKYYIMVQAFDDVSKFQINGYYPKLDMAYGSSTVGEGNWYRDTFRYPTSTSVWRTIYGAPYGSPFDFKPTSVGSAWMQMRYPWDVKTRLPKAEYSDPSLMLADFDQYLYPSDWTENGAKWDYDWAGTSHWTETSVHGDPVPVKTGNVAWARSNSYEFQIEAGAPKAPNTMLHYIPCLWMVSSDAALGQAASPKTGMSTIGYRASLVFPQNLRMLNLPASVKKGSSMTVTGTLAINPAWAGGVDGAIAWAPAGTKVTVQRKAGTARTYKSVGTAVVGANGAWSFKTAVNATAKYRAVWQGSTLQSIGLTARKGALVDGAVVWEPSFGYAATLTKPAVFDDGSVNLEVAAIDAVDGVTLHTTWDTAVVTGSPDPGTPWASQTLKVGESLAITMSDGTHVEVTARSLNYFTERSLVKKVFTR